LTNTSPNPDGTSSHRRARAVPPADAECGAVAAVIRAAIAKRTGSFSVAAIADDLRSAGFNVKNGIIARVLRRMRNRQELYIAERGGGGVPHRYQKTEAGKEQRSRMPKREPRPPVREAN
jgi:hypothetical protein